ncbi:serine hydrolase [Nocardioides sp. YIM 152315]|nr:serine hydrolase [Nocardioides sp. YIM 152315]
MAGLLVLLVLALPGCGDDGPASVGGFVAERVPDGSSGTLVAARGDDLVLCRGWGESDRAAGVDAGCDTVYDIMSMTKQFTAAAVLTLWQDGRLRPEDRIGDLLADVPADKQAISVEQLLTHTSGLLDSLGEDDEPLTRAEFLERALGSDLLAAPGAEYHYSNVGYSLLAVVIEEVSGLDYERYLRRHLFEPAGMTSTGYVLPDWSRHQVAVEYDADGGARGTPLDHRWADDGPYWNLRGNGGLLSTARDLYRWHRALLGDRVLTRDTRHALFEPRVQEAPDDTWYAYGWVVGAFGDSPVRWHNGGNDRSYGEIARDPGGDGFVFWVTNQARSADGWDLEASGGDLTAGVLDRLGARG